MISIPACIWGVKKSQGPGQLVITGKDNTFVVIEKRYCNAQQNLMRIIRAPYGNRI